MTFLDTFSNFFPKNWAKWGKNDPFFDKSSLKQGKFSLPELPKRGGVKNFPCSTPRIKNEGVPLPPGNKAWLDYDSDKDLKTCFCMTWLKMVLCGCGLML